MRNIFTQIIDPRRLGRVLLHFGAAFQHRLCIPFAFFGSAHCSNYDPYCLTHNNPHPNSHTSLPSYTKRDQIFNPPAMRWGVTKMYMKPFRRCSLLNRSFTYTNTARRNPRSGIPQRLYRKHLNIIYISSQLCIYSEVRYSVPKSAAQGELTGDFQTNGRNSI